MERRAVRRSDNDSKPGLFSRIRNYWSSPKVTVEPESQSDTSSISNEEQLSPSQSESSGSESTSNYSNIEKQKRSMNEFILKIRQEIAHIDRLIPTMVYEKDKQYMIEIRERKEKVLQDSLEALRMLENRLISQSEDESSQVSSTDSN